MCWLQLTSDIGYVHIWAWLSLSMVLKYDPRCRALVLMWMHVFSKYSPPEFGHSTSIQVRGVDIVLKSWMVLGYLEYRCLKAALFSTRAQIPVLGHQMWTQPWSTNVWMQSYKVPVLKHQCSSTKCERSLRLQLWGNYICQNNALFVQKLLWAKTATNLGLHSNQTSTSFDNQHCLLVYSKMFFEVFAVC